MPTTFSKSKQKAQVRVRDLMQINARFQRSVQIELDIHDPHSTDSYIATDFIRQCFDRIGSAFQKGSTRRAWRITGDYGSGKSAFALAMAKSASGRLNEVPEPFRQGIGQRLHPVIVTGEREPLHGSIGKAIKSQLAWMKRADLPQDTTQLIDMIHRARNGSEQGIFLILDELGKNLEYAMMEPQSSDAYTLQRLAEVSSRTDGKPLVMLAILHMGISTYTGELDTTARKEWDKIAARFEEILFHHPFEQVVQLFAAAVRLDQSQLPHHLRGEAMETMGWAVENGFYGSAPTTTLQKMAPGIFPLHPISLPPLMQLLRRFGQNERSLFGFIAGHEPSALQDVAGLELTAARFFRLNDLYNYVRHNIAHAMSNGRATHWRIIESVVRKAEMPEESDLLKTIGILNLLDDDSMLATRSLLRRALGWEEKTIEKTIRKLQGTHALFERGAVRGFALWPHTSVHLDDAFADAKTELGEPKEPMQTLASLLASRQIVARKHYIETGNLRHFELQFHPSSSCKPFLEIGPKPALGDADGHIAVFLPENEREYKETLALLTDSKQHPAPNVLIGLTRPPVHMLGTAKDLRAWNHVAKTVAELASDEFARRELRSQIRNAKEKLNEQIDQLAGLNYGANEAIWFRNGKREDILPDGLSTTLSSIAEGYYKKSPVILNEMINRRLTSSAASRARTVLIEAIATNPEKEFLGMDASKNPPEMALYVSILQAGKIHVRDGENWKFVIPEKGKISDPCNLHPAFAAIEKVLKEHDGQRVKVPVITHELRMNPIGARDGVIPLILALYLAVSSSTTAVYEDSTYIHGLGGEEFQRLQKEPEAFEFQHCAIEGLKLETFQTIATVFGVAQKRDPELLDVVNPLVSFVAALPEYSRNTKKLSQEAIRLRDRLLSARDPATLIFREVPEALGIAPDDGKRLGTRLAKIVGELQGSYDQLLTRLGDSIRDSFQTNADIREFRQELTKRCKTLEPKLVETDVPLVRPPPRRRKPRIPKMAGVPRQPRQQKICIALGRSG